MDCQRLSREACAHAAQNRRLPVQVVVQVLYYDQERLVGGRLLFAQGGGGLCPRPDELSYLRRENEEVMMELMRIKASMREADGDGKPPTSPEKPLLHSRRSLINSVSRKIGRLNPFVRSAEHATAGADDKALAHKIGSRDRPHSTS
jgi:hypothetical protein